MQRTCRQCQQQFKITPDDLAFYENISPVFRGKKELIPPPLLCPLCRSQRRLSFRNERHLYKRKSDRTGKQLISIHAPGTPFPVYEPEEWYADSWDAMRYGVAIDFHLPFFEQFHALQKNVPRLSLAVINNENCPYVNQTWNSKNCYLCFDMGFCEDALFCTATYHSKNVMDCIFTRGSTLSYALVDCWNCYHCIHLLDCRDCHDAYFSVDCQQCQSVAFCHNLRNKQYCLFNEQLTKDAWEKALADLRFSSYARWREHTAKFHSLLPKTLRKPAHNMLCEDCTGDYLLHSRNCSVCFDGDQCQDLRYCNNLDERVTTAMDVDHAAIAEVVYEGLTIAGHEILFTHGSYSPTNHNLLYCDTLVNSSDCFGCISLRNKRYCILNKQYTREKYEELVPKLIAHMRSGGEWGEFFPTSISLYAYNQTAAQEYFPLTKEEVRRSEWRWREEEEEAPKADRIIGANELPDSIDDIPDDILNWAIGCEATKRPFKIIKQELEFYRQMKLPVPRFHPDERHKRRMAMRNPRKLWERNCMKCQKKIQTSYSPKRQEIVYCENCYLKEVY